MSDRLDGFGAAGGIAAVDQDLGPIPGQLQRDRGVGDVVAGFHGVDGLTADADLARELGYADAAAGTDFVQLISGHRWSGPLEEAGGSACPTWLDIVPW